MVPDLFFEDLEDSDLARKADWFPFGGVRSKNPLHKIDILNDNRLEIVPKKGSSLVILYMFLLTGAMLIIFSFVTSNDNWITALITGSMFFLGTLIMILSISTKKIFDKKKGSFWVKRSYSLSGNLSNVTPLKDIQALQLIAFEWTDDSQSYTGYQLNLILTDSKRVNIFNITDDLNTFLKVSEELRDFLRVPIWDGIHITGAKNP